MNSSKIRIIVSAAMASIVCVAISYLVAKILVASRSGFGTGDLSAFLYWTVFFAAGLFLPALAFAFFSRKLRVLNRIWISFFVGGVAGFGWTLLNLVMLGPWFGAWSFNVLYCWVSGGAAGLLVVAIIGRSKRAQDSG